MGTRTNDDSELPDAGSEIGSAAAALIATPEWPRHIGKADMKRWAAIVADALLQSGTCQCGLEAVR
jgi:hypothetical protein